MNWTTETQVRQVCEGWDQDGCDARVQEIWKKREVIRWNDILLLLHKQPGFGVAMSR